MKTKARVNLTIDKELNEKWSEVSQKIKMSKSQMVEVFLSELLPILENNNDADAKLILSLLLRKATKVIDEVSELI
jgi:hypothetical protein